LFNAGGSFYYVKPFLQNNTAFLTTIAPATPNSVVSYTNFHWSYEPAGAFWLGWNADCGLGARGRFFFYDQESTTLSLVNATSVPPQTTVNPPLANFLQPSTGGTAFGSPGAVLGAGLGRDELTFNSDLKIYVVDVEATYAWKGDNWTLLASGGGRYLTLTQSYKAALFNGGDGLQVTEFEFFNNSRKFYGGGLVAGLQGNVGIGQTGLAVFASGRGSLVVGNTSENLQFIHQVNDATGLVLPVPGVLQTQPLASRSGDHTLSTVELELGLEYGVKLGDNRVFVRAAGVNHTYFDAGNASQSTGNLSLFGLQFSLGLNY
jgi:hypothetical protein